MRGVVGVLMGMGEVGQGGIGGVVNVIPCFYFIIIQVNYKLNGKWCFGHLLSTKMNNQYPSQNPDTDKKNHNRRQSEEPIREHQVTY